jgi:protein FrlC
MKLAYHTYAFGSRAWLPSWTLEEAIGMTVELGFDGLELAACRPHAWPWDLDQARRKEMKRLASDCGLPFSGICPVLVYQNIASCIPEERAGSIQYFIECLKLSIDLECPRVVFGGGWSIKPYTREEAWKWAAESLASIAIDAERLGVVMALENINSRRADVVSTSRDIAAMIEEVGSPALQAMIDLYHLHLEGDDPIDAIEHLAPILAYVHFLDARREDRARLSPGRGELPLAEILLTLQRVGYDGWLGCEIWGDDPMAPGRQAVKFFTAHREIIS